MESMHQIEEAKLYISKQYEIILVDKFIDQHDSTKIVFCECSASINNKRNLNELEMYPIPNGLEDSELALNIVFYLAKHECILNKKD